MITTNLKLKRVPYGKDSTPLAEREYHLGIGGPVGNVEELKDFYKGKYITLTLYNKDLTEIEQVIKL